MGSLVNEKFGSSPIEGNGVRNVRAIPLLTMFGLLSLIIIVGLLVGLIGMRGEARR